MKVFFKTVIALGSLVFGPKLVNCVEITTTVFISFVINVANIV